ncbi:hypothetical protein KA005_18070 [bacterium]|nr:hypothetical protein [bacterium]
MKFLASDPIFIQQFELIDADKGVIKGVKVCSEGEAKGHGVFLNKKFIKDVVRFGKEQNVGVKARFGHPNMCDTTLGTFIGRFKNFRSVGEENENFEELGKPRKSGNRLHAVADLYFDETAKELPKIGNAWSYLTNLAESSPDMFGSSIVFHMGEIEIQKWKDDEGEEHQRNDATIHALLATDLVDSPAATEGLFSEFTSDEMAIQVTHFLEQHPEVYELAIDNPEIIETFLKKYESFKNHKEMTTKKKGEEGEKDPVTKTVLQSIYDNIVEKYFTKKKDDKDEIVIPDEHKEEFDALQKKIDAFEDPVSEENEALKQENEELKADISKLQGMLTKGNAKSTKVNGLKAEEDADEGKQKTEEEKGLEADVKRLRGELTEIK